MPSSSLRSLFSNVAPSNATYESGYYRRRTTRKIAHNNLRRKRLVTMLRIRSEQDLRNRIDDQRLLSEGRIVGVEWQESTTSLEDCEDCENLGDTTLEANSNDIWTDTLWA